MEQYVWNPTQLSISVLKEKLTEQFQMEALQLKNTPSIEIELMIFQFDIEALKKNILKL